MGSAFLLSGSDRFGPGDLPFAQVEFDEVGEIVAAQGPIGRRKELGGVAFASGAAGPARRAVVVGHGVRTGLLPGPDAARGQAPNHFADTGNSASATSDYT